MTLSNEEILDTLNRYDRESKALREEILRLCWYMRGGLTYEEGFMLGAQERELVVKIAKENMETTKKSGLPFF